MIRNINSLQVCIVVLQYVNIVEFNTVLYVYNTDLTVSDKCNVLDSAVRSAFWKQIWFLGKLDWTDSRVWPVCKVLHTHYVCFIHAEEKIARTEVSELSCCTLCAIHKTHVCCIYRTSVHYTTKGLRVPISRSYHWTRYLISLECSDHTANLLVEHSDLLNEELPAFRSAKHKDRTQSNLSDR